MNRAKFDCIVIGKGLIGSAAAKYLAQSGLKTALIGPDEPTGDLSSTAVFASHYDQGRVQRLIGIDPVWTRLNQESAKEYPLLEKESGIHFHYGVGCLYVSPSSKDDYLKNLPDQAALFHIPFHFFETGNAIHQAIPHYQFSPDACGMLEGNPSGHIHPLRLIKAQLSAFENLKGIVITDTVNQVSSNCGAFVIRTMVGNTYNAKKILIAAGAFSNFLELLPRKLDMELESETVLLAQVDEAEADRLSNLPSLLYEIETDELNGIYLIRPIQYPDGHYYLKMGCNLHTDIHFHTLEEIQQWFRCGDSEANLEILKATLHRIMPSLKTTGYITKRCIISRTKHRKCYIGKVDNDLFIAAGGNGYSAMCSDALGKVAAHYVINETYLSNYPSGAFSPVFL